jgi:putative drug exporter of the RND superfamily
MLAIWVVALIGVSALAQFAGGELSNDFRMPGTESQAAFDLLEERFPERSGDSGEIVFASQNGVSDPRIRSALEDLFTGAERLEGVEDVASPFAQEGGQINRAGTVGFADIQFDRPGPEVPKETIDALMALRENTIGEPGLQVEYSGLAFEFAQQEPPGSEMFGLVAAIIILLIAFGSFLAMALPILSALFGNC